MSSSGIPTLLNKVSQGATTVGLLVADAEIITRMFAGQKKYAIYRKDGTLALAPDSIVSLDFRSASVLSQYPVEEGSFAHYNKVANPYQTWIQVTKGGSDSERDAFLVDVNRLADSTDLLMIKTPERVFRNVNLERIGYRKTARHGATLLTIDLVVTEIRQVTVRTNSVIKETKEPDGAPTVNGGVVQPVDGDTSVPGAGETGGRPAAVTWWK